MTTYERNTAKLVCENAIQLRKIIRFYYESKSGNYWRKVEPYLIAIKDKGRGNVYITGYAYPSKERKTLKGNDDQGQYLINKIDLKKFEILDATFDHLKIPSDRIFGELPTVKIICRVSFD